MNIENLYCIVMGEGAMSIFNSQSLIRLRQSHFVHKDEAGGIQLLISEVFMDGNSFLVPESRRATSSNIRPVPLRVYKVNALYIKTMKNTGHFTAIGVYVGGYHSKFSDHVNLPKDSLTYVEKVYLDLKPVSLSSLVLELSLW